jgi:hypothetical protein
MVEREDGQKGERKEVRNEEREEGKREGGGGGKGGEERKEGKKEGRLRSFTLHDRSPNLMNIPLYQHPGQKVLNHILYSQDLFKEVANETCAE